MNDGMIKITSLWKNKSKSGTEYLSGYLGDSKIMVFPNGYKKEDKHPDYVVYIAPNKKKDEGQSDRSNQFPENKQSQEPQGKEQQAIDDIPF